MHALIRKVCIFLENGADRKHKRLSALRTAACRKEKSGSNEYCKVNQYQWNYQGLRKYIIEHHTDGEEQQKSRNQRNEADSIAISQHSCTLSVSFF